MGHFLKIKCAHSLMNLSILSSTRVLFTLTTVQVPNLALTYTKRITVYRVQWFSYQKEYLQKCTHSHRLRYLLWKQIMVVDILIQKMSRLGDDTTVCTEEASNYKCNKNVFVSLSGYRSSSLILQSVLHNL
jgi:hypothetical protein